METTALKINKERGIAQEARFEYKGYQCSVLFTDMGHRCGYVGFPRSVKWRPDTDMIDCHGGVTYDSYSLAFEKEDEYFWVGFDCAHYGDGRDIEKTREYFGEERANAVTRYAFGATFEPKSLGYCIDECKRIVEQMIKMREGNETDDTDTPMYIVTDAIEFIRSRSDLSEDVISRVLELEEEYMRSLGLIVDDLSSYDSDKKGESL